MRKSFLLLFVITMILTACSLQTKTAKESVAPKTQETSESSIQSENAYQNFIIIQTDNQGFPQNQGVYDFNNGTLHIVKQYIPEARSSNADTRLHIIQEEKIRQMLEDDLKKHFANQTIQKDPYFAYETTYNQCTVNVDKENFTIRSKEFTIDFTWIDRKHQIIEDENHVLYQIYQ